MYFQRFCDIVNRLTSGIRKKTLIVNFPGSEKACRDCLPVLAPVLRHAVDLIRDKEAADETHRTSQNASTIKSKVSRNYS